MVTRVESVCQSVVRFLFRWFLLPLGKIISFDLFGIRLFAVSEAGEIVLSLVFSHFLVCTILSSCIIFQSVHA